ncbi:MAG TPA: RluA family pseudouridine synthase [Chryseolinea sp.]|nr:RluA family pseudouridine synthase [Chryseolinea sp.]
MSVIISVPDHILYEDEYILVINKPASLMVEPDRNGYPNLLQQVQKHIKSSLPNGEKVYAQHLHRLDRPVSGIVLFARKRAVLKNLSEQFAERRVKKLYQALTDHSPQQNKGTLQNWLRKEKKKATIYDQEIEYAEKVILDYEVTPLSEKYFLWKIELHTGKYHQIRAQLAHINCPIIGDLEYGSTLPYKPNCIALHACQLIFFHPISNETICIEKQAEFQL